MTTETESGLSKLLQSWTGTKRIHDYHFIAVTDLLITPKVRLKCMNGCPDYDSARKCPPVGTLTPEQCSAYLKEYSRALIVRFYPDENQLCPQQAQTDLLELERQAFSLNNPFALAIFPKHCAQCQECRKDEPCKNPQHARFSVSSMCIDILGTMEKLGIGQAILTERQPAGSWFYIGLVMID